jgi:hypothetical protein
MYIKPNKTFVLSKQTKRMMCSIVDTEARNQFKRMMIQAELAAAIVPKSTKGDRGAPRPQGTANYVTNDTGTASTQV